MAKKGFDYDSTAEQPWRDPIDRPSITERAERPKRAMALTRVLVSMPQSAWSHLPVDEAVVEALEAYARIHSKSRGALKRQTGHICNLLQSEDLDSIEEAIGDGATGRTERDDDLEDLVRWRARILEEGAPALTAFFDTYPEADRQRVRQLAKNCAKAGVGSPAATKASRTLFAALKEAAGL